MPVPTPATTSVRAPQRHILLIEDNRPDAMLTQMVHDEVKHCSTLHVVEDGDAALAYLCSGERKPDVIFLDLTLPKRSGLEVMVEIKSAGQCGLIPIVIFSASGNPSDVRKAYELGASSVIRKPANLDEFYRVVESCYEYWCSVVVLPSS
jgi:chemotaxis family two-component system response regulator Rcp1